MEKIPTNRLHLNEHIMGYIDERIDDSGECHNWIGPTTDTKKIGRIPRGKAGFAGIRYSFQPHILIYNRAHWPAETSPVSWEKNGDEIRRDCGNKYCLNPKHLVLGKRADTIASSIRRGTTMVGNQHNKKYDHDAIRADHKGGMSYAQLMKKYGISSKGTISHIINKAL